MHRDRFHAAEPSPERKRYRDRLITLGGTNIFNNAAQEYGYLGLGTIPLVAPAQLILTMQERF